MFDPLQQLTPASVDLMVVANLLLDPADVYLLPHTVVKYTVFQLKQGHLSTIDVPASQFYLQVCNFGIFYCRKLYEMTDINCIF